MSSLAGADHRVLLGNPHGDHLSIALLGRAHPGSEDYWDGNWVLSPIAIHAGGFQGTIGATLRMDELAKFHGELGAVYETLSGAAVLDSMEDWLKLTVRCEPSGVLAVDGIALDQAGHGNQLRFELGGLDQSHLPPVLDELEDCLLAYPVLGTR
ncbi:WapI family immunity protein [Amycolatopsis minnesotensis]